MTLKLIRSVLSILFVCFLGLSLERRAYAYIDPGTGLLVLQGVGTVFASIAFYMRRRLRSLFSKPQNPGPNPPDRRDPA